MINSLPSISSLKKLLSVTWRSCMWVIFLLIFITPLIADAHNIVLAKNGKAKVVIIGPEGRNVSQQFSIDELRTYLGKITGADFTVAQTNNGSAFIKLERSLGDNKEAYEIITQNSGIIIKGNSDRALLFAVYDFLGRLGCQWLAPQLDLYEGVSEIIPHKTDLSYSAIAPKIEQPVFAYRKIDVDGGRSHTAENLALIIDWMAKVRYNTLRVPVNLNGNDRVQWDKWRSALIPELKKRDLLLEIGGHGYQNFIHAKMEDGKLFQKHPEWFGKDSSCMSSPSDRLVFNTSDTNAVKYFTNNIISYIKQHPEINIFGLWPPDVGRWADCKEMEALGTPADRQAALANKIAAAIYEVRPEVKLEIIAYSYTLLPPQTIKLHKNIQVDFCPINQSFEKQIYDSSSVNNLEYVNAIKVWRQSFTGEIGLYSYYRKYAWRSAPNVIPHYIQKDMQWYAKVSMQGISTYAEPGDWYTYELNHYILAHVAWNPHADVNTLCDQLYKARYANQWQKAKAAYVSLENLSPKFGSIPFTTLKSKEEIATALHTLEQQLSNIKITIKNEEDPFVVKNFSRLLLMLQYLQMDLMIQKAKAAGKDKEYILSQIKEFVAFLEANLDKGVFILTGQNDLARFTKKYGLTNQSLLD
jgi:hypothetical protein